MTRNENEDDLLRSVALQNARSILQARLRAEEELVQAKDALEARSAELARSLAMMRATLDATSDGILATDNERRVTGYNGRFVAMWRLPDGLLEAMEHRHPLQACTPQLRDPTRYEARLDEIYRTAPTESSDLLEFLDGRIFERISRIQYLDGNEVGRVWSFRDITKRKQADEALLMLAAIVESSEDAIISKDLDGIIRSWNRGAERLFGYAGDEVIGQPVTVLIPPELIGEEQQILQKLRRGERIEHFETIRVSKQGRRLDISLTISPIRDEQGRIIGVSKIARNITERRLAEEALRDADRRKDEFLALLAHELRNPLAPLRNGLQVMRLAAGDAKAVAQARAMMERQLGHIVRLVDDLLDLARIGQNKIELRPARISLKDIIDSAVETARPAIEAAGHELTVALPAGEALLDADLTRLAQVFSNLLTNSAKYTEQGGHIWIAGERCGDEVIVTVRDTGIGIPANALPGVFDMFSQVDRSNERATGGLGIGLALVKGFVEMHGGSVIAESEGRGKGSQFTVRLPTSSTAHVPTMEPRIDNEPARAQGRRILIVDDNEDAARSMARVLSLQGNEVLAVHDGTEAIDIVETFQPHVILMDVGMPRMNGYEAARRIRKSPWGRTAVIIAVTGWGQDGDRVESREAGCDGHLVKPVDLLELEKLMDALSSAKRAASPGSVAH